MRKEILIAGFVLFALSCKKNISAPPTTPQNPIGEVNIKIGDSTSGDILVEGISKNLDNGFIISGYKGLYDSTVGYLNFFPMSISINDNLKVTSSKAPLLNDYGLAIQSIRSGEYIYFAINTENLQADTITGIKIIKTDTLSNIIWNKSFSNTGVASGFTLLSNGDMLLQGNYATDVTGTSNTMFFARLDKNGNTVFYKEFTGQFYTGSLDIIEEANNYTLVTYQVVDHPTYYKTVVPAITKIDFSGNVISTYPLEPFMGGNGNFYSSFHLRKNKIGGYILTASYSDIVDPTVGGVIDEYFYLRILNAQGIPVNSANLWLSGTQVARIADVLQTKNGNIYVLLCLNLGTDWTTQIVKYDAKGNYIADKGLPLGRYAQGLVEAENNNIIIVQDYSANTSITLLKMDPELNNL